MRAPLSLTSLTDDELIAHLPEARRAERRAVALVIAYLGEVERRRLYLGQACSSMFVYCTERLGYSENEAQTRIAVARACLRFPEAMANLEAGAIHLTGLWLLAPHLTDENASALLSEARGKSRRQIEALLARRFPKPDVLPSITPLGGRTLLEQGDTGPGAPAAPGAPGSSRARVEPLSATSFRVEFTASAALRDKLERARDLLSHAEPGGDLAAIIDRAIDELIAVETKRRDRRAHTLRRSGHTPRQTGCAARCSWSRQRQRRGHEREQERGAQHDSKGTHQAEAHRHAAETHRRGEARRGSRLARPARPSMGAQRALGRRAARAGRGEPELARRRAADRGAHPTGPLEARNPTPLAGQQQLRNLRGHRLPPAPA
jgi:hypothetical protein